MSDITNLRKPERNRLEVMCRFNRLPELKKHAGDSPEAGRDYVETVLGLQSGRTKHIKAPGPHRMTARTITAIKPDLPCLSTLFTFRRSTIF